MVDRAGSPRRGDRARDSRTDQAWDPSAPRIWELGSASLLGRDSSVIGTDDAR